MQWGRDEHFKGHFVAQGALAGQDKELEIHEVKPANATQFQLGKACHHITSSSCKAQTSPETPWPGKHFPRSCRDLPAPCKQLLAVGLGDMASNS